MNNQAAQTMPVIDDFNGDNAKLIESARALISLSDSGSLAPHGIGGHARAILSAFIVRTEAAALSQTAGVPDGWKLVPVEPTEAMCEAAMSSLGWSRPQAAATAAPITPASPMMEGAMKVWSSMLATAPAASGVDTSTNEAWAARAQEKIAAMEAASGGEDKGDPVCHEDDGCPTEGAVLKRFWRSLNTDDTKQLMAFYGVADVAALIEQQVQHVQLLQIKLKAHEPKRDQFPKSPREG